MSGLTYLPSEYMVDLLMNRHERTIVVEGANDVRAIERLVLVLKNGRRPNDLIIDSAEMIESPGEPIGNAQKVEMIYHQARAEGLQIHALVDREYREFDLLPLPVDRLGAHHTISGSLHWTRGHSLENYLVCVEHVIDHLEAYYPEYLPHNHRQAIASAYATIIHESAACSLAAFSVGVLERMDGLFSTAHWNRDVTGDPKLNADQLQRDLLQRGVSPVRSSSFGFWLQHYRDALPIDPQIYRWLIHGHFALDLLWTGIAASLPVMPPKLRNEIAVGHKDKKRRAAVDFWAKQCPSDATRFPSQLLAVLAA